MKTSRPVWTPAYGRLEKTQTYNLSLEASAHDWRLSRARGAARASRPQDDCGLAKEEGLSSPGTMLKSKLYGTLKARGHPLGPTVELEGHLWCIGDS